MRKNIPVVADGVPAAVAVVHGQHGLVQLAAEPEPTINH